MNNAHLVYRAGGHFHALPLRHVIETMRPQPYEPIETSQGPVNGFVKGLAVIRGEPCPVVDLGPLAGRPCDAPSRFVTVRAGGRRIALMADAVVAIRPLTPEMLGEMPQLLKREDADIVTAIGALDGELLLMLGEAHVVPDAIWAQIDADEAAA